jgi:hypothetical protein
MIVWGKSIGVEKDIPRILWKIKESIPQMLHQHENFGEGADVGAWF